MRSIISTIEQKPTRIVKVHANKRNAFTLVELMVVVAIMAVLGALVAGVVVKAIEAQKNSNTKTTMEVIKSALSKQLQAVIDDGKKKEVTSNGTKKAVDIVNATFPQKTNDPMFLRQLVEKGPFSKLDSDLLPKGAISDSTGPFLDAWGDPITVSIEYYDRTTNTKINNPYSTLTDTQKNQTKIKFTISSQNISESITN